MSSKTVDELVSASVDIFGNNLSHLETGGSQKEKWALEGYLLLAQHLLKTVKAVYQDWLVGVRQGHKPFDPKDEQRYTQLFKLLVNIFSDLETRIANMEVATHEHVAHSESFFISGLELQSLLKQKWVPVAPVSMAFEEIDVEGENEEFLAKFLSPVN